MDTSDLIRQFNESKAGHVINGSESFRNRMGRVLHGLSYNHPRLAAVAGIGTSIVGTAVGGPIGALATSPALFSATYAVVTPKRFEKAACDFLMNQGVRKASAFSNFLEKQGIDPATREAAVAKYLEQQAPKFGYYKEYQQEFPAAAKQIVEAGTKGDLPLRHSQDLYKNEIIQETLTRERRKGGILKGLIYTFTKDARRIESEAEKLAAERWADRQAWLAQPAESRGTWRSFYKDREFQRSTAGKAVGAAAATSAAATIDNTKASTRLPQQDVLDQQFERFKSPESTRTVRDLKNRAAPEVESLYHPDAFAPNRDMVGQKMSRGGDLQQVEHIRDGARVAESLIRDRYKVRMDDKNNPKEILTRKEAVTDYLDPKTQKVVQHVATFEQATTDLKTKAQTAVITESTTTGNGTTHSRTQNTGTGETIYRKQTPFSHKEWQFDKDKRLTSFIDNDFGTTTRPGQYRQTDYTYDQKGRLQSSVEKTNIVTPDGETSKVVYRDANGAELSGPPGVKNSAAKQGLKTAGGFAMHAAAGLAGGYVGEALKDRGAVAESNGGGLLYQQDNELTMAKRKAFANLGAAGMATAASGIALAVGEKAIAKAVGKKAAVIGTKAVPVVGTAIGLGMAGARAFNGDFAGAGLEIAGAAVDYVPFVGQAASLSIDATLAARDIMMKDGLCAFGAVNANGEPIVIKDEKDQDVQAVGAEITYKNDKKEGMAKWYDFDKEGKPYVALVGTYKDDAKTGEWVRFNAKGDAVGIAHFDQDRPVGQLLEVDNNGNVLTQGNLTQGSYVEYHRDENGLSAGVIAQEGSIKDGKTVGTWHGYDKSGNLQSMVDYDKGYYEKYQPKTLAEPKDAPPRIAEVGQVFDNGRILKTGTERPQQPQAQTLPEQLNSEFAKVIQEAQGQSVSRNAVPEKSSTRDTITSPMGSKLEVNSQSPRGLAAKLSQVVPTTTATTVAAPVTPNLSVASPKKDADNKLSVTQMAAKADATSR